MDVFHDLLDCQGGMLVNIPAQHLSEQNVSFDKALRWSKKTKKTSPNNSWDDIKILDI